MTERFTCSLRARAGVGFGLGQQLDTETALARPASMRRARSWSSGSRAAKRSHKRTSRRARIASSPRPKRAARPTTRRRASASSASSTTCRRPGPGAPSSVTLGGSLDVLGDRVTLRALTERSLGDRGELDFPERTAFGLDYHLTGATTLFAEIETPRARRSTDDDARRRAKHAVVGAQIASSVNREFGEYGPARVRERRADAGVEAREAWAMDAGVDRSDTIDGADAEGFNPNVPLVVGSVGEDFRPPSWRAVPRRRLDVHVAPRAARLRSRRAAVLHGRLLPRADRRPRAVRDDALARERRERRRRPNRRCARLYAYRPRDSRFIVLERLDLVQDERDETLGFQTTRFVNNVNLHWQFDRPLEFGTQIGARYAESTIDVRATRAGRRCSASTCARSHVGRRSRRTRHVARFASRRHDRDRGRLRRRHLRCAQHVDLDRLQLVGFDDEHFDAAPYTAQGPYGRFRIEGGSGLVQGSRAVAAAREQCDDNRPLAATPEPPASAATLPSASRWDRSSPRAVPAGSSRAPRPRE